MTKTGRRECFVVADYKKIDSLRQSIKSAISEIDVITKCDVNIYSDPYSYLTLEVSCPSEEDIKSVDMKTTAELIKVFEKEGLENHFLGPLEIESEPSEVKKQDSEERNLHLLSLVNDLKKENKELKKRFKHLEEEVARLKEENRGKPEVSD